MGRAKRVYDRAAGKYDRNSRLRFGDMDVLSDVLNVAHLNGGVFLEAEFTEPWCVGARMSPALCAPFLPPSAHLIPYHYVIEGELWLTVEGEGPRKLQRDDLVLFPRNDMHVMGSEPGLPIVNAGEVIVQRTGKLHSIRHGGGGKTTRLVCGYLGSDTAQGNPVLTTLPSVLKLQIDVSGPAEWIRATLHYAASEVASGRPGSETVLAKVSELLFVEAIRRYVENLPADQTGWLAGLRDPAVARALTLMHHDVAHDWSVEELGHQAGLSRSALAERFTRVIGIAPMQYLARWRMHVASQKLRNTASSLAEIAALVGYESEAPFSRAFKKAFGTPPATWRRAAR